LTPVSAKSSIAPSQRHAACTRDGHDLRIKAIDRPTKAARVGDNSGALASCNAIEREDASGKLGEDAVRGGF
jgi:hypothetical protein